MITLAIIACLFNFLMDEAYYHYDRFLGKIIPDKWDWWFDPSVSHTNKYFSQVPVIRFLFTTLLVWVTDFWHFAKFVSLMSIGFIIVILEDRGLNFWQHLIEVLVLGFAWFFLWEFFNGIINVLSNKLNKKI